MALATAVAAAALLLMTADVCLTGTVPTWPHSNVTNASSTITTNTEPTFKPVKPVLGFLTINWTSACTGDVVFSLLSGKAFLVCSSTSAKKLLANACKHRPSCKDSLYWRNGKDTTKSFLIGETGAEQNDSCISLEVKCTGKVPSDLQGQLKTYKVMTALLCCVLVVILLVRFSKPTVKALQKRLSDRRQNRWIGPTQSHSVSYHRGKTVQTNDGEMRLSYPALERLTVSDSREPSSNRNSGYNF